MERGKEIEIPESWSHERAVIHLLKELLHNQHVILCNQEKLMSATDTLNANIAKLKTDVDSLIASQTSSSEAAIQAAADAVAAIDTEVVAATPISSAPTTGTTNS
jgi:hypothetical protein